MNNPLFDRRDFLKQAGAASSLLLLDRTIFGGDLGLSTAFAPMVRKDIDTLTPAELTSLRNGIRAMQLRPATSRISWTYQANIHGDPTGTGTSLAWNTCQHGTFFFLSWHRMYLYWLERILRAASGNPNLTLPYWNYSKSTTARALPAPFRTPTINNPLFVASRNPGINTGSLLPASAVSTTTALGTTNFTGPTGTATNFGSQTVAAPVHFSGPHGRLESTPHDAVHVQIGGWMGNPNMAARDPIFWLHHANIDRLWNQWLTMGGGRVNPLTSAAWKTPKFTFFNETGGTVTMSACQILISATQLNYRYDTDTASPGGTCPAIAAEAETVLSSNTPQKAVATKQGNVVLGQQPTTVKVSLGTEAKEALNSAAAGDKTYVLSIEGITYPKQPGVHWEVFLNLPASAASEPDIEGGHFVGNLSFFARKPHGSHAAHAEPDKQTYDITELVRNLRARNLWNEDQLSVTFVARGLDNPDGTRQKPKVMAQPKFTRVSLVVE